MSDELAAYRARKKRHAKQAFALELLVLALLVAGTAIALWRISGKPEKHVTSREPVTLGELVETLRKAGLQFKTKTAFVDHPDRPAIIIYQNEEFNLVAYQFKDASAAEDMVKREEEGSRVGRIAILVNNKSPESTKMLNRIRAIFKL